MRAAPLDLDAASLPPAAPVDQHQDSSARLDEVLRLDPQRALPGAQPFAHVLDEPVVALGLDRLTHLEGLRGHLGMEDLAVAREVAAVPVLVEALELVEVRL